MCEVDAETLAHAHIVVDQREAAMAEAGDLLQALASGHITNPETWVELGELVEGLKTGRQTQEEVTFFKSVGVAVQELAVAVWVYQKEREIGVGVEVDV